MTRRAIPAATLLGVTMMVSACAPDLPEPESPGAVLYSTRCGGCHRLYHPGVMTADMWAEQVERMQREFPRRGMAPLSPAEVGTVLGYLQAHSLGTSGPE
jgi:hypothetical protein